MSDYARFVRTVASATRDNAMDDLLKENENLQGVNANLQKANLNLKTRFRELEQERSQSIQQIELLQAQRANDELTIQCQLEENDRLRRRIHAQSESSWRRRNEEEEKRKQRNAKIFAALVVLVLLYYFGWLLFVHLVLFISKEDEDLHERLKRSFGILD